MTKNLPAEAGLFPWTEVNIWVAVQRNTRIVYVKRGENLYKLFHVKNNVLKAVEAQANLTSSRINKNYNYAFVDNDPTPIDDRAKYDKFRAEIRLRIYPKEYEGWGVDLSSTKLISAGGEIKDQITPSTVHPTFLSSSQYGTVIGSTNRLFAETREEIYDAIIKFSNNTLLSMSAQMAKIIEARDSLTWISKSDSETSIPRSKNINGGLRT